MNNIKLPVKAVQEEINAARQVWYVMDADGNKMALSNKESVDAIVEAMNTNRERNELVRRVLELETALVKTTKDAKFMANVWNQIKQHGYEFITEGGDPDGVDFVADCILGIQS